MFNVIGSLTIGYPVSLKLLAGEELSVGESAGEFAGEPDEAGGEAEGELADEADGSCVSPHAVAKAKIIMTASRIAINLFFMVSPFEMLLLYM